MPTVGINTDELYPVYSITEPNRYADVIVNVDDETLARWEIVRAQFRKTQTEMSAIYHAAEGAK
jgi:hypothetical protein